MTKEFESAWAGWNGARRRRVQRLDRRGARRARMGRRARRDGAVPVEHLHGDAAGAITAGARVEFVDCNRDDLCMSFEDFERKVHEHKPKAAFLVHIGGHIAFDSERIAELCRSEGIVLIEDCAHAHGAEWNGRRAGTFGDAGIWSFARRRRSRRARAACSSRGIRDAIEFARTFRNYGKPDYAVHGLNFRMNEFTAALGIVQVERLDEIVAWKNEHRARRTSTRCTRRGCSCPTGMTSGPLQVHRLRPDREVDRQGLRRAVPPHPRAPTSTCRTRDWVAENHWCVPLYYRPEDAVRVLVTGGAGLHRLARRRQAASPRATSRASST